MLIPIRAFASIVAVLAAHAPLAAWQVGALPTNRAWADTLGAAGNDWVQAMSAHEDGGVFVAGRTSSFGAGSEDFWVTRLDRRGLAVWEVAVGTSGYEEALALAATPDGGCLVGGGAFAPGASSTDAWVVKLDAAGAVTWQRTYASADEDHIRSIALSPDGYYLGGTVVDQEGDYDAWVLEIDTAGNVLWQQSFAAAGTDFLTSVTATEDGLAFVANSNSGFGKAPGVAFARPWLVRMDGDGNVLWQKTYDFSGGDAWNQLVALEDGGFIAVGEILFAAFFRGDVWAVRLAPDGQVLWDLRMGDHDGNPGFDGGVGVRPTADGGFAILGATETAPGGLWMFQLDAGGALVWNRSYGGTLAANATAFDLASNGSPLLAGVFFDASDSDSLVVRLTPNGQGPTSCKLASPTHPNVWSSALAVEAVSLEPSAAAHVTQDTGAGAGAANSTTYLCPPGVASSGGPSLGSTRRR